MKSRLTKKLERMIFRKTQQIGTYGCMEVTIGRRGNERVDFITMDSKGTFRCYEIKSSVADFRSKSKHTFIGHYNYYVMPETVYLKVCIEVAPHVGVINENGKVLKKPVKQPLGADPKLLKENMFRSFARDAAKWYKIDYRRI